MTGLPEARRITGPHLLDDRTGAALDVPLPPGSEGRVEAWAAATRKLLDAVGWADERICIRRFSGGANLFVSAPLDALHAATDLADLAWISVDGERGERMPDRLRDERALDRLRQRIAEERRPAVLALAHEAERRGLTFLLDDDGVSVGSGTGVVVWPADHAPDPADVDWRSVFDIPIALVTGSNGKTTTVRLATRIAEHAGHRVGSTTTDGVRVGEAVLAESDFAGPMGARLVLRDRRVTLAILETARGGILRRGLAVRRADAAAVTNIAEDHFGDFGVNSLDDLADAKLVVGRAVESRGYLVLNAGDPLLRHRSAGLAGRLVWFAADPEAVTGVENDDVFTVRAGELVARMGTEHAIASVVDIPATLDGAAVHNVENALAAAALVSRLPAPGGQDRISIEAMRSGLTAFGSDMRDNAGRGNLLDLDGIRVLVDYAHNADALAAVARVAATIPARRRLLMIGQAGDRTDDAIRGLARAGWALDPDLVLIKELDEYRRGRNAGEVPRLIAGELARIGAPLSRFETHPDEISAVNRALEWARPGDLLILLVHQDRARVMSLLDRYRPAQRLE